MKRIKIAHRFKHSDGIWGRYSESLGLQYVSFDAKGICYFERRNGDIELASTSFTLKECKRYVSEGTWIEVFE